MVMDRTLALMNQVRFQQNLIDSIPVPIYFKDTDLHFLGCNKAFEDSLGLTRDYIVGRKGQDILPADLARGHHIKDLQLLKAGESKPYEVTYVYPDDTEHDFLVFKALYYNKDRSVGGLIGTELDITERKQAHLQIEMHSKELENTNTALRVLLKQVNENKTQMEARVLDTFARLIAPYLDTLEDNLASTPQEEYIKVIRENFSKITSSFSMTLSSSYLGLSPREIQIADLVRHGRTNKEAARILNISINAVEFHRNNLRKKLGIQNRKVNLRTHLLAMH
jgi:PAS domain S-box-containing protein